MKSCPKNHSFVAQKSKSGVWKIVARAGGKKCSPSKAQRRKIIKRIKAAFRLK